MAHAFMARFDVYSPRWGHADPYVVSFNDSQLQVWRGIEIATCGLDENGEPKWQGSEGRDNSVMNMFSYDQIHAPSIVPFAIVHAWKRWRDGVVTDEEVLSGLTELFSWIDQTARSKPSSSFWQGAF